MIYVESKKIKQTSAYKNKRFTDIQNKVVLVGRGRENQSRDSPHI